MVSCNVFALFTCTSILTMGSFCRLTRHIFLRYFMKDGELNIFKIERNFFNIKICFYTECDEKNKLIITIGSDLVLSFT